MQTFRYDHYKSFLKSFLKENTSRGAVSNLAVMCGCDRTYISQVINGKADLTPDHIIQLSENLGLNPIESQYLLMLVMRDRSGSIKARGVLDRKLASLKREALAVTQNIKSRENPSAIDDEKRTTYYSSWVYGAVHILTSIEGFQAAQAIANKLSLPLPLVQQVLRELVEMKLVRVEKGNFVHSGQDIYLERQFVQNVSHHLTWRTKSVERTFNKEDIHYTVTYSVSEKDYPLLRDQIMTLIEDQRTTVRNSGAEVACTFCLDFFAL